MCCSRPLQNGDIINIDVTVSAEKIRKQISLKAVRQLRTNLDNCQFLLGLFGWLPWWHLRNLLGWQGWWGWPALGGDCQALSWRGHRCLQARSKAVCHWEHNQVHTTKNKHPRLNKCRINSNMSPNIFFVFCWQWNSSCERFPSLSLFHWPWNRLPLSLPSWDLAPWYVNVCGCSGLCYFLIEYFLVWNSLSHFAKIVFVFQLITMIWPWMKGWHLQ